MLTLSKDFKVCLDSRLIAKGEYFVPVKGENFDGHAYIDDAIKNSAAGIIEEERLYQLVKEKLSRIKPIIIGVTGSSGKTSVTQFLSKILSSKYTVTLGNLNTKLGLSVNVINDMTDNCQIFVAEMGMDRIGELKETTDLFPLDIAIITTINHVHVAKLGSMPNLVKAKGEILDGLKPDGVAILNHENAHIRKLSKSLNQKILWFDSIPLMNYPEKFMGKHNDRNLNSCVMAARLLHLNDQDILEKIKTLNQPKGRINLLQGINGSTIIDDTYNSNPESVIIALEVLRDIKAGRRIAVLGDMLELGLYSIRDHKEIGKLLHKNLVDIYIGVGEKQKIVYENCKIPEKNKYWLSNSDEFKNLLGRNKLNINKSDVILVKGSQGIRMEKIVKMIMKNKNEAAHLLIRQDARWK